ncbi:MAG: hypothetical protein BWK80_53960, partial [Desulfobacteraceae bacterium IS3]
DDVRGWNFCNNSNDPKDEDGHGTHCAGIIAAVGNNGKGVTGVCWKAKIMPLKIQDKNGFSASNAVSAILYANANGADVINNSWGGGSFSQTLKDAIDASSAVVVCAAGNGDDDKIGDDNDLIPSYPSSYESANIISVAATDHHDSLRPSSNYGAVSVDIAAPGENIYSTVPAGYFTMSGTSMAAPYISGTAAILKAYKPSLTNLGIKAAIEKGVDTNPSLFGKVATGGRLNAHAALKNISSDEPAEINSPTPGSSLTSATVTFTWTDVGADNYRLEIGNSTGTGDFYSADQGRKTSATVNSLPSDGRKLYVRLKSDFGGLWQQKDHTYTAYISSDRGGQKAVMISPEPGSALTSTSVTFTWSSGGAERFWIYIGTSKAGSTDVFSKDQGKNTSVAVSALPDNGAKFYVRLWSLTDGYWQYKDCTYKACSRTAGVKAAEMLTPLPGSTLTATSVTFTLTKSGVDRCWLYIGTSAAGAGDIYAKEQSTNASATVSGLPNSGVKVYVRLWSFVSGKWVYNDYTYTAFKSSDSKVPAEILTPVPGTVLTSASVTFTWSDTGAAKYWLCVGISGVGASDVYRADQGIKTAVTVSNLPRNKALYVRLRSVVDGKWLYKDYTYTTAP